MNLIQVEWVTVFVAAVLYMIVGFVWYSKWLFGPLWMKLEKVKDPKPGRFTFLYAFISALVIAYFLAFFKGVAGVTTARDGMILGFFLWLGFVATTEISSVIWHQKPLLLFSLHTGCKLFSILVMSGVIGA